MTRARHGVLALLVGAAIMQGNPPVRAQTQPYNFPQQPLLPQQRPTVSPYLNLLRGGNLALNYYGLVRPQTEFRRAYNQIQGQVNTVQQDVTTIGDNLALPPTGHAFGFQNHSKYFMRIGGAGAAGGVPGGGIRAPTPNRGAGGQVSGALTPRVPSPSLR